MRRMALVAQLSPPGLGLGVLLWLLSLTPTLIARGWAVQGLVSGICLAAGYGIGASVGWAVHRAARRAGPRIGGRASMVAGVALVAAFVVGGVAWAGWQDQARNLVGLAHVAWWEGLPMVAASLAVALTVAAVARWIGRGFGAVHRLVAGRVDGLARVPATVAAVVVIGVVGWGVGSRAFVAATWAVYDLLDTGTNPGIERTTLATVSGGPGSLVAWDTMGRWGRDFAALTTSPEALRAFHGSTAQIADPIRVFVGMRSAPTPEARAAIAVRELERTGAFERSVLVVWVPAGSGWMDPNAAIALEQLYAGDSAIVAMQYSYLPSFFSQVIDSGKTREAGRVLFDAVHARWSELPATERPRLVVFGASLGAAGAEAPFVGADATASLANVAARADGALLVGGLRDNTILRQVTDGREPGSTAWRPVYGHGEEVRFMVGQDDVADADVPWGWPRVLILQHPSDPVSHWSLTDLWSAPEWMNDPPGPGVPAFAGWIPIVTAVQAAADVSFGASLPSGFGHDYRVEYVEAFARLVPPDGWDRSDTARLQAFLAESASVAAP
jgi:uncharacterized membrane protein